MRTSTERAATDAPFRVQDIKRAAKVLSLVLAREALLRVRSQSALRVRTTHVDRQRVCSLWRRKAAAPARCQRKTAPHALTQCCSDRTRAAACACMEEPTSANTKRTRRVRVTEVSARAEAFARRGWTAR